MCVCHVCACLLLCVCVCLGFVLFVCVHMCVLVCVCLCSCLYVCACVCVWYCVCVCAECCLKSEGCLPLAGSTVDACFPQTLHTNYNRNLASDLSSSLQNEIIKKSSYNRQLQSLMASTAHHHFKRSFSWTENNAQIARERGASAESKYPSSKRAVSFDLGVVSASYGFVEVVCVLVSVCAVCESSYVCLSLCPGLQTAQQYRSWKKKCHEWLLMMDVLMHSHARTTKGKMLELYWIKTRTWKQ